MTTYNWLCTKSDSKFSRRLLVQCDSTRKNVNLGSLTLIMAGSALIEMFGGIILGFTRNVAENDNPNEVEFGLETFGFNPLERTGLEWTFIPSTKLFSKSTSYGHNGRQGIINACSPENHKENIQNENVNGEMEWKRFRPSIICKISK